MSDHPVDIATAGQPFEDPEFASLPLSIDVDETLDEIDGAVKGLHTSSSAVGTKVRTTDGMLVAVVQATATGDGPDALLHYRIEPASEQATRKGTKIGRTLEQFESDAEPVASQ